MYPNDIFSNNDECPVCNGEGCIYTGPIEFGDRTRKTCPTCNGTGTYTRKEMKPVSEHIKTVSSGNGGNTCKPEDCKNCTKACKDERTCSPAGKK